MTGLPRRTLGRTGLPVSALGYGAGNLGDPALDEADVGRLLHAVLDAGITLIDTARSYGLSEARIGRHLAARRGEFQLSTKVGYGVAGVPDWTGPCISGGIDRALRVLRTDHIDVVFLHSCDADTLRRHDILDALTAAQAAGKVGALGYSGENHALWTAIEAGVFDVLQCSVSVCDQGSLGWALPKAPGRGVVAKRALANAVWRHAERPTGRDGEVYWDRRQALGLATLEAEAGLSPGELALRFSAFAPGVDAAIVATRSPRNLAANLEAVARGPLPDDVLAELRTRWATHGAHWPGWI